MNKTSIPIESLSAQHRLCFDKKHFTSETVVQYSWGMGVVGEEDTEGDL